MKVNKTILILDSILILGSLVSIFFLVGYTQPLVIAPFENSSEDYSLLFSIPKTEFVLLDESSIFDSPQNIFINESFSLKPGRYFIKFYDGLKSEIRQIDFLVEVDLEFREVGDELGLFNKGSLTLSIDTYEKGSLINSSLVNAGVKNEK